MPWLVVEGAGSWKPNLGREWEDSPLDPHGNPVYAVPSFAPLGEDGKGKHGRWLDRAKTYKAGAHRVPEDVARQAIDSGYAWLIVMPDDEDEPTVEETELSGTLTLADVKEGKGAGLRLKVIEGGDSGEPESEPEPVFEHECAWCLTIPRRTFPSSGSLARHIEFDHPAQHLMGADRAREAALAIEREREELRRLSEHDKPVPIWDREAVEDAGLPTPPEPDPTVPQAS